LGVSVSAPAALRQFNIDRPKIAMDASNAEEVILKLEIGLYVATHMGHVFLNCDEGKSWKLLIQCLPPIYSVSAAVPSSSD